MDVMLPLESAEFINKNSEHVKVGTEGVKTIADLAEASFKNKAYTIKTWKEHPLTPNTMDSDAVDWIFMVNSINFSFYHINGSSCYIMYKDKMYQGYYSLCAAIARSLEEGIPICDAQYYQNISFEDLRHTLRPTEGGEMPLLAERQQILNETGTILMKKFNGSFNNCIIQAKKSAQKLLHIIVDNFPSYRDEAVFKERKVSLYKRAQIVIADLWACFEGKGLGEFKDIDSLTMFADYRVPQILYHYGALIYSEPLLKILNNDEEIKNQDPLEVEIRGNSIWAVELIVRELKKRALNNPDLKDVCFNSSLVDFYLWESRVANSKKIHNKFHKTRCIYY